MEERNEKNVREVIYELLEEICGDDVVRHEPDINLLEEDLIDSLDYTELLIGHRGAHRPLDGAFGAYARGDGHAEQDHRSGHEKAVAALSRRARAIS